MKLNRILSKFLQNNGELITSRLIPFEFVCVDSLQRHSCRLHRFWPNMLVQSLKMVNAFMCPSMEIEWRINAAQQDKKTEFLK